MMHRYRDILPQVASDAWVAESAEVIGDVVLGSQSSVWFQCVIRGDVNAIRIGQRTNIQDHSTLHVTQKVSPKAASLSIGDDVTIGHRVLMHGCTIMDRCLIGMGTIILDHAVIEEDCIIGAGSLVLESQRIPRGHLAVGSPARVVRQLRDEEIAFLKKSAAHYVKLAEEYRSNFGA
jgi:carbonic anhydrase/acetyltransferase-like protein (isoleucine patch superfamily)